MSEAEQLFNKVEHPLENHPHKVVPLSGTIAIAPVAPDNHWEEYDVIVCLLSWGELLDRNCGTYPRLTQESGKIFFHFPVLKKHYPREKDAIFLLKEVRELIAEGKKCLIQCSSDRGRAIFLALALLLVEGIAVLDAVKLITGTHLGWSIKSDHLLRLNRLVRGYQRRFPEKRNE